MDTQLKKGLLDACVLAHLKKHDDYGYQILKDIAKVIDVSESTLYPILRRLEQANYLSEYSKECDGRLRKYYGITPSGLRKLTEFREEWKSVVMVINFIEQKNTE